MKNIAIIGSGTWGVALAMIKHEIEVVDPALAKHLVPMCVYRGGICSEPNSCGYTIQVKLNNDKRCKFLPDAVIGDNITCYTDIKKVIEGSEMILHVTPSKFVRETIKKYKDYVTNQPIIMCA